MTPAWQYVCSWSVKIYTIKDLISLPLMMLRSYGSQIHLITLMFHFKDESPFVFKKNVGCLPSSTGTTWTSWSWGYEFKSYVGCRTYFKKKKVTVVRLEVYTVYMLFYSTHFLKNEINVGRKFLWSRLRENIFRVC